MTRVHLGVLQEVSIYMVSADGRCLVIGSGSVHLREVSGYRKCCLQVSIYMRCLLMGGVHLREVPGYRKCHLQEVSI